MEMKLKYLSVLLLSIVLLVACGSETTETEQPNEVNETAVVDTEARAEQPEEPEAKEPSIELSESKVSFTNFTVEIENVEIKDNKLILETLYTNDSFDGEKSFMAAAGVDVHQNGELLEEVSGVMENPSSNYFYKNDVGIWVPVEFEYELQNETDDIEIMFVPRDWDEDPKSITITLQ